MCNTLRMPQEPGIALPGKWTCGRDGLPSFCWLYYQRSDFAKADFYCSEATNATQRKAIMDSFMAAQKYCLLGTCRRKSLLQYFGEEHATDCGNCDNCTTTKTDRDLSKESFLLLSCIKSCGGNWGLNMPVDVLRGARDPLATNIILNPGLAFGTGEHLGVWNRHWSIGYCSSEDGGCSIHRIGIDPQVVSSARKNMLLDGMDSNRMRLDRLDCTSGVPFGYNLKLLYYSR